MTATQEFDLVLDSLKSEVTKENYKYQLKRFDNWLFSNKTDNKTNDILRYLAQLKSKSYGYRMLAYAAIRHRYTMNDVVLNWDKIVKFLGQRKKINTLKAYTRDDIRKLLEVASVQYRAIILLYCSTGIRRRALLQLKVSDLEYLEDYKLYKIIVYKKTDDEYVCFTTPEAAEAIKLYIKQYNLTDNDYLKDMGVNAMSKNIRLICDKAHISKIDVNRNEKPAIHAFKKFCITQMAQADKDKDGKPIKDTRVNTEIAKLLTDHTIGIRADYVEYSEDDLLQEYLKSVDRLTINDVNRLRIENTSLREEKNKRIKELEEKVSDMQTYQQEIVQMFREREAAYKEYTSKTDEQRKQEHENELRERFPPGKYKHVKLMENVGGKWQEVNT